MRADIEKRLAKLEQSTQQDQQRITRIVLTSPGTDKETVIFEWSEQHGKLVAVDQSPGWVSV